MTETDTSRAGLRANETHVVARIGPMPMGRFRRDRWGYLGLVLLVGLQWGGPHALPLVRALDVRFMLIVAWIAASAGAVVLMFFNPTGPD